MAVSERPGGDAELVTLDRGGLATSSTRVRRWTRRGVRRHHLLDPRTGQPATEVWRTVTATGPTCVAANTASTVAIVLGEAAPAWLAERQVTARLVARDGTVHLVGGWPAQATNGRRVA
ncbi:FAD:protein FMN transferase [Nocardia salmonicida]|uniref:FAD:protein FMN transferase n=1 Tax=Nocardia salmonicida TaxID=53431 RepID=UPI00340D7629